VFDSYEETVDGTWHRDSTFAYNFMVDDTVGFYDLFINLRNESSYRYSNLYLFVEINFPNGKRSRDTVECPLADPTGRWYGSGLGDLYDNRILYKRQRQFPLTGEYSIVIEQAMRDSVLRGISDVGFRLTRSGD